MTFRPVTERDGGAGENASLRVAQYVRMSTDHQRYSTENQEAAIAIYALRHGMAIVRTYADEGRSGLDIAGRDAFQRLVADIEGGSPGFEAVLVYDVSRWGRFQNQDEAAFHEYRCLRAGVRVLYCSEQFENDGSFLSNMAKTLKRSMAGEYSRELSNKVFQGQCRLIEKGFRQGGPPGFGLRRCLIDERGEPKATLERGQQKSLQTDRVVLVPGPDDEVAIVGRIYRLFVDDGRTENEIAGRLNAEGHQTDLGRAWTRGTVHQILTNEKYVGNNVFNRTSFKLKKRRVRNVQDDWVRATGAFQAIVDHELFQNAAAIIAERSQKLSDAELLERLAALFQATGILSGIIIDEREDMPSSSAYRSRFGSLLRAYSLVGYSPRRDYRYVEINKRLRVLHHDAIAHVLHGLEGVGAYVQAGTSDGLLRVNDEFFLSIVVARCQQTAAGSLRWRLRFDTSLRPDVTIAVRMDKSNLNPRDYYIFPSIDVDVDKLHLADSNPRTLDAYRFDTPDILFAFAQRTPIPEAA
ncbi:hypothetical protein KOAAANKH_03844 [Brevundimonas sp. NIBR10]|uniref:recombinase family protein n=1 Tax=Brevundimonas sp. NIBR10 TaxID=3015997 RepID=UPI0022F1D235|nr:recombinase family protein [Brevundimonas sp. NIBR10]WGM48930.1 hypothetical protein KOAAANKH_03844 [Brevundimonas sp. NIBR10]